MIMKHIHVVGAVIVQNNKVLCVQRGPEQSLPYKWEFPGGKIEEGESPQTALKREIKEELTCNIEVGQQNEYTVHEYPFGIVHLTSYYCQLIEGKPQLTEHMAMRWLKINKLHLLNWAPADIPAVKKIMNGFKDELICFH